MSRLSSRSVSCRVALCGAACFIAAGCAEPAPTTCRVSATGPVTSMLDGPIDLVSGGGFDGRGDGSSLHIDPDGTMTQATKATGTRMTRLDAPTIDALHSQIDAADFATLGPNYGVDPDGFTYNLSVDLSGTTYRVLVGTTASDLPVRLSPLVTAFRDLLTLPICD